MNKYNIIQLPDFVFSIDFRNHLFSLGCKPLRSREAYRSSSVPIIGSEQCHWLNLLNRYLSAHFRFHTFDDKWGYTKSKKSYTLETMAYKFKQIKGIFCQLEDNEESYSFRDIILQIENLGDVPTNLIDFDFMYNLARKYSYETVRLPTDITRAYHFFTYTKSYRDL